MENRTTRGPNAGVPEGKVSSRRTRDREVGVRRYTMAISEPQVSAKERNRAIHQVWWQARNRGVIRRPR